MRIIDSVIMSLEGHSNDPLDLALPTEDNHKLYCDFYGDTIDLLFENTGADKIYVACNMGLEPRVLDYIRSRDDRKHRHIRFYETLRLAVVLNIPVSESMALLQCCNYSLHPCRLRDRLIYLILSIPHRNNMEMDERLDCLSALEVNEPFNDNGYDYRKLFNYLLRKREN